MPEGDVMRGVLTVKVGHALYAGNLAYPKLTADEKDEICDMLWDQIEDADAIPWKGYGLTVTEHGFSIDGDLGRVDEAVVREVLDEYCDYEYSIHRSAK